MISLKDQHGLSINELIIGSGIAVLVAMFGAKGMSLIKKQSTGFQAKVNSQAEAYLLVGQIRTTLSTSIENPQSNAFFKEKARILFCLFYWMNKKNF